MTTGITNRLTTITAIIDGSKLEPGRVELISTLFLCQITLRNRRLDHAGNINPRCCGLITVTDAVATIPL